MSAKVYFFNMRAKRRSESLSAKVAKLFDAAGFANIISENDLVAIKIHFGEKGNNAYINPVFVRQVVEKIKNSGGKPFLTDTNTLYKGSRSNGIDHIVTAIENGFAYAVAGAPVVIADGIVSKDSVEVKIEKKHFETVKIASGIYYANSMIVMSHFKGHEMAGFGGAIKNLAMGCAPAAGKQQQHSTVKPFVDKNCRRCLSCIRNCPEEAISLVDGAAYIDPEKCVGCGECISMCYFGVIKPQWKTGNREFIERMTEYACGAFLTKKGKIAFMNFVMNVTPLCDCTPWSDAPLVPDVGILASLDPVAIDQASYDLVTNQHGHRNSALGEANRGFEPGEDKFAAVHPEANGLVQLEYAEKLGMGTRKYELVELN
ncbi:DUF362 domain-containing protein [Thermosediminibacter litoriperuensis]|uniref:Ferredoxin n=1 Tax=Thermosediminibacter litoriperuensis TaxID=291989 RepID=A0A5S5APT5_9FIRM|nr:DUF362 domain-containing protein [Thermosediminibacter litoriperuensis]TYP53330.1 hypothetical protein LZ11_01573 [Thermosediminibacter litoriperuensis]